VALGPPFGVVSTTFTNYGNQNYFVVVRGGCWVDDGRACRSAYRFRAMPNTQYRLIGFRVACDVESEPKWREPMMANMIRLIGAASLLLVGCTSSSNSIVDRPDAAQSATELGKVTFYIAGMNQRLRILWGDWPNKVKQALLELEGVESVEDEWERELESEQDLDLLFVTYETRRITIAKMLEMIHKHEFEVEVKDEG
jgi:hypothetical protein